MTHYPYTQPLPTWKTIHLRSRSFILRLNKYQHIKQQILEANQGPTRQLLEATTEKLRCNPDQTNQVESKRGNHRKNDLVWILEDFTLRGKWPLGKVVETFTGSDGIARSCVIKTALESLNRPAMKLALVEPKLDFRHD